MINRDVVIMHMNPEPVDSLYGWEERLIEWCFKYPENNICNVYFNALMKKEFRDQMHGGKMYAGR